jgi:S1-C subfamily serine protease
MTNRLSIVFSAVALIFVVFMAINLVEIGSQLADVRSSFSTQLSALSVVQKELSSIKAEVGRAAQFTSTVTVTVGRGAADWVPIVYENVKDSVVMITVDTGYGTTVGSGFVYDDKGHIVTNNHVVADGIRFTVSFLDGTVLSATLVGRDPDTDLAVLKIDPKDMQLKPLKLGNSSNLKIGEQIIAVGNPFELAGSVTLGIVSQKGRLLPTERGYLIPGIIQIDAAVNPGNSGGPLLNSRGEVVGVTTAIESMTGEFAGIGYAISSNIVARVVPVLIEKGRYRHSYLGITGIELNSAIAEAIGIKVKQGFLVTNVSPGSPAANAGIRAGNRTMTISGQRIVVGGDVIVAINGVPVKSLDDILTYLVEKTSPGDKVTLTVIRDGSLIDITVTLGERP